jgi:peptide alpha-N-acetyltransferase
MPPLETGDLVGALAHLEEHAAAMCDRNDVLETRAKLLLALGDKGAEARVMDLLRRNPHNVEYYCWIEAAVSNPAERLALYSFLRNQLPANDTLRLQALAASAGDSECFRAGIADFLRDKLTNESISGNGLFRLVKCLYSSGAENAPTIIGEAAALVFAAEGQNSPSNEAFSVRCYHFLALHCFQIKDFSGGLAHVDQALELVPDLVDLHVSRAKLLKHVGQQAAAVAALATSHALDPGDRWVGSKYAKYLLRAGQIDEAISVMNKYTKVRYLTVL